MKTYDVILIDAPWQYHTHSDKRQPFAENHYNLMTNEDIYNLPIKELTKKTSIIFVWATSPKLHNAIQAIQSWGLQYRGIAHTWVKTTKDGRILNGTGVRPTYAKPQTELLLFATLKPTGRPMTLTVENLPQQVLAPREGHSVKPNVFQELIERAYPDADKLELFARRHRSSWDATGIELTGHNYLTDNLI